MASAFAGVYFPRRTRTCYRFGRVPNVGRPSATLYGGNKAKTTIPFKPRVSVSQLRGISERAMVSITAGRSSITS